MALRLNDNVIGKVKLIIEKNLIEIQLKSKKRMEHRSNGLKMYQLNDLKFKSYQSCLACKRKNSPQYGECALENELTPFLEEIKTGDALIIGSPV